MLGLYIIVFIVSCLILFWSGSRLVKGLMRIARFLGLREFVVAFFVMAIAGSLPNLFVGINSALHGIPELSFGDIVGGNMVDLTLAVALAILIGGRSLPARSKLVQTSTVFTVIIAVLPLVLIFDGVLSGGDGLILISAFFVYLFWLFSRKDRFQKVYNAYKSNKSHKGFKGVFKSIKKVAIALILLLVASEGIVRSAGAFSEALGVSLPLVGILIIGLGNALPETYFAIVSARKKNTFMILGNLMGSVIICSTLILGIVALIAPIQIHDFSPFAVARAFLIISALFFFIAVKSDKRITRIEGLFLLLLYVLFVLTEVYLK